MADPEGASVLAPHLEAMNELAAQIAAPVLDFYKEEPGTIPCALRPLAALNAVASLAGMILAGTNCDEAAMKFFADAVVMQAVSQMDKADEEAVRDADNTNTRH